MLTCKQHPTYIGRSKPRAECQRCYVIWLTAEITRLKARHEAILEAQREFAERNIWSERRHI